MKMGTGDVDMEGGWWIGKERGMKDSQNVWRMCTYSLWGVWASGTVSMYYKKVEWVCISGEHIKHGKREPSEIIGVEALQKIHTGQLTEKA